MASPDTDELATAPFAAGAPGPAAAPRQRTERGVPEAETASQPRVETADSPSAEAASRERVADSPGAETAPEPQVEPERIEPAPAAPEARVKDGGRWWRGFTGSLAAGLTVLAVGVLVVTGICVYTGAPGPGATLLIGHPVAAALAVMAQRVADRRNGLPAVGAGVAVVLFTVSALTLFWLTWPEPASQHASPVPSYASSVPSHASSAPNHASSAPYHASSGSSHASPAFQRMRCPLKHE